MNKAVAILRVSDPSQRNNMSREGQLDIITKELAKRQYLVVESFSEQKSGMGDRVTVPQAYEYCRRYNQRKANSEQIKLVAVLEWDRWFRHADLSGYWRYLFSEIGVQVNAVMQWEDRTDPGSIVVTGVHRSQAHAESVKNSRRTKRGIYYSWRAGRMAGRPPRGYIYTDRVGEGGRRIIGHHPDLAPKYRRAFLLLSEGNSIAHTYELLGGREAFGAIQTFRDAIRNELYAGRKNVVAPFENLPDLQVKVTEIQPIIDFGTFQQVQKILAKNFRRPRRLLVDDKFFPRTSLRCPCCDSVMTSESSKGRSKVYHYLRCANDYRHYRIRLDRVVAFLPIAFRDLRFSAQALEYLRDQASERVRDLRSKIGQDIGQLKRMHEQATTRQRKAMDMYVDGLLQPEEYETYRLEADRLAAEISRQEYVRENQGDLLNRVMGFVSRIDEIYRILPGIDRMAMLKMVFPQGFYIDTEKPGDSVTICRTARINSIFAVMGADTKSYASIKIESPPLSAGSPVKGHQPGFNRTVAEDFRAFELFTLRLSA